MVRGRVCGEGFGVGSSVEIVTGKPHVPCLPDRLFILKHDEILHWLSAGAAVAYAV
jgi:hypothetical protein